MGLAYLFAALGWMTPIAGVHRFYLNRPFTGVLYLLTWGLLGVGTLIDMFLLPGMVSKENLKDQIPAATIGPGTSALAASNLSTEQQILRTAAMHDGAVTVAMVALHTTLTLDQASRELDRMRSRGHCSVDVNEEGAKIYIFAGLFGNEPLVLD